VPVLYIVLVLVLAAFGLLVLALTTANTLWAWISVVLSVVAATLLITDWVNGRRRAKAGEQAKPTVVTVGGRRAPVEEPDRRSAAPVREEPDFDDAEFEQAFAERDDRADRGDLGEIPTAPPAAPPTEPEPDRADDTGIIEPVRPEDDVDPGGEPGEEPTDAADLLIVSELTVEVRVVDEHPRYHLANCRWLAGRGTIPLAISEARQLGFTPCARCGPDAVLAARHRAGR
jgi:hypothetical protein